MFYDEFNEISMKWKKIRRKFNKINKIVQLQQIITKEIYFFRSFYQNYKVWKSNRLKIEEYLIKKKKNIYSSGSFKGPC